MIGFFSSFHNNTNVDGLGVAIVSGEYVERDLEEGRLVRPFETPDHSPT